MAEEQKVTEVKEKPPVVEQPKLKTEVPTPATPAVPSAADVLDQLKRKADLLGVGYATDITIDVLRAKIKAHQEGEKTEDLQPAESKTDWETRIRKEMYETHMRLIRVRITNLNPAKKDLKGEIWTVSNKYLGTVRRFIPYGEATDNGWHIEAVLLDMLKERQFNQVQTKRGDRGQLIPINRMVREFAIEELTPLTAEEIRVLANQQAAADGRAV